MTKKTIFTVIILILSIGTAFADTVNPIKISTGFTMNDHPATTIYYGKSKENITMITVYTKNLKIGYTSTSKQRNNRSIDVSATLDKDHCVQSSKHNTHINLTVNNDGLDI